jgi:hypothetical protein
VDDEAAPAAGGLLEVDHDAIVLLCSRTKVNGCRPSTAGIHGYCGTQGPGRTFSREIGQQAGEFAHGSRRVGARAALVELVDGQPALAVAAVARHRGQHVTG